MAGLRCLDHHHGRNRIWLSPALQGKLPPGGRLRLASPGRPPSSLRAPGLVTEELCSVGTWPRAQRLWWEQGAQQERREHTPHCGFTSAP